MNHPSSSSPTRLQLAITLFQLAHRVLSLIADGPHLIVAAGSRQLAHLRHQAEQAMAQAQ